MNLKPDAPPLPINMVHMVSSDLTGSVAVYVLLHVALLNIVLAMFNLIPIPPLDGSHLFKYLLPQELRPSYEKLDWTGTGFIILILVININGLWNIFSTAFIGGERFFAEHPHLFLITAPPTRPSSLRWLPRLFLSNQPN